MRRAITQAERDYCTDRLSDYTIHIAILGEQGRIDGDRYERCLDKLNEWGSHLNTIEVIRDDSTRSD